MTKRIAVVFGSDSDWPVVQRCVQQLRAFHEEPHVEVMSAHRNPARVSEFASAAEEQGFLAIIAAAGMSNALSGTVAAHTILPVIGWPLAGGSLQGLDALLSTVQMPPGVPVASVALGEAGARNAAILALQIVARTDRDLAERLRKFKAEQAALDTQRNQKIQDASNA